MDIRTIRARMELNLKRENIIINFAPLTATLAAYFQNHLNKHIGKGIAK